MATQETIITMDAQEGLWAPRLRACEVCLGAFAVQRHQGDDDGAIWQTIRDLTAREE